MKHYNSKKQFENELYKELDRLCLEINSNRYDSDVSQLELKKDKLIDIKKSLSFMDDGKFAKHSQRLQKIFDRIVYPKVRRIRA
ncbi:MAG: hypothetical protein AB8F74_03035 [Saprospiraceae bacterium]